MTGKPKIPHSVCNTLRHGGEPAQPPIFKRHKKNSPVMLTSLVWTRSLEKLTANWSATIGWQMRITVMWRSLNVAGPEPDSLVWHLVTSNIVTALLMYSTIHFKIDFLCFMTWNIQEGVSALEHGSCSNQLQVSCVLVTQILLRNALSLTSFELKTVFFRRQ